MLRKVILTGVTATFRPGSLLQLIVGIALSAVSLAASAWVRPYANSHANVFKLATEFSVLSTLTLCMLLKMESWQLKREGLDESFIGLCMVIETLLVPAAALVSSIMFLGFEVSSLVLTAVTLDVDHPFPWRTMTLRRGGEQCVRRGVR